MKKSRFTESQIVAAIKKQETGIFVKEICREMGISEPTLVVQRTFTRTNFYPLFTQIE